MKIGPHKIDGRRTFIIAEAGTNHLGRFGDALAYCRRAHECGADAVKFQMFTIGEALFCPMLGDVNRQARWAQSCMRPEDWRNVKSLCDEIGIVFLASAFQPTTVRWLREMDVAAYKVASRAAAAYPYDAAPGPFIVSCGMALPLPRILYDDRLFLVQCKSIYPTPLIDARWVQNANGLSDHSGTLWPGLDAMARGCPMLEVHFSIEPDKSDAGPDKPVCLSVVELKLLCEARDAFAEMRK